MNEESAAMRNFLHEICAASLLAATSSVALAQSGTAVPVTVDNYNRAQSDVYFGLTVQMGAFGKFVHGRKLTPIDKRGIIRPNRDTLYSFAVFDFDAGPVTIQLPDAGKRFMSMQVINEDQYTPAVYYGASSHTLTGEGIGTRYGIVVVRMLVDPANPQDVQQVQALQDVLKVSQQSPGTFEIPNWDEPSLKKVRAALLQLGETICDTRRMFGANKNQVDPVRHLVGTALVWGGLPEKDALYLPVTPARRLLSCRTALTVAGRAVKEYLPTLNDAAFGAATEVEPKFVSPPRGALVEVMNSRRFTHSITSSARASNMGGVSRPSGRHLGIRLAASRRKHLRCRTLRR